MQIVGGQQILNDLILKETPQEKEDPRIWEKRMKVGNFLILVTFTIGKVMSKLTVDPDGSIVLPVLITVLGMTSQKLSERTNK